MSLQPVGVTPTPPLPVPEQPSALNQETHPTITTDGSTKPSLTSTLTPGVSPPPLQSPSSPPQSPTPPPQSSTPPPDNTCLPLAGWSKPLQRTWNFCYDHRWPIGVWLSLIALIALSVGGSVATNSRGTEPLRKNPCNTTGVGIIGQTLRFDSPATQKLTVRWSIIGCMGYALGGPKSSGNYALPNIPVDVYLNNASDPAFSYDPDSLPGSAEAGPGRQGVLPPLDLVSFESDYRVITGEQYRTPLDRYDLTAFVFVIDPAKNRSVPIVTFEVGDTGMGDFVTKSDTRRSMSNFTIELTADTSMKLLIPSRTTYVTVRRTVRAQALTFLMFAINWLLTLCTVAITGIVLNRAVALDSVAVLPISTILSVPAIRALYIGSPPFGIFFDLVGFFPQMIIVVTCAMVVLFVSVLRNSGPLISPVKSDPPKGDLGESGTGEKKGGV